MFVIDLLGWSCPTAVGAFRAPYPGGQGRSERNKAGGGLTEPLYPRSVG
jgi:hypothetical protein